jgi:hypothetical protein
MFCDKYLGKVYPEKKLALSSGKMSRGEEEVTFFCKVLVVEELGDYYNLAMQKDQRLAPIVRELNRVHHIDESRHLAMGRAYLTELCREHAPGWNAETRARMEAWLLSYLNSSWADYYNPTVYKDAGLPNPYQIHTEALASPICAAHRQRASEKLVNLFVELGLLSQPPELRWTE